MDCSVLKPGRKRCSACKRRKSVLSFGVRKSSADGRQGRCLVCARKYARGYYDKTASKHRVVGDRPAYMRRLHVRHKEWLVEAKARPCADCGGSFAACCMEFDHVRGSKRHNLAEMSSWSRAAVLEEMLKCEVVCANCHRIRTERRRAARKLNRHLAKFRAFVAECKQAPCVECGGCFEATAMDFDHVRGVKVASISDMWAYTRVALLLEIAKCDLVCANCHRVRTSGRQLLAAA